MKNVWKIKKTFKKRKNVTKIKKNVKNVFSSMELGGIVN